MINKIICILLLILFFILLYLVTKEIKKSKLKNNIENFKLYSTDKKNVEFFENNQVNFWTDDKDTIDLKTQGLNENQKKQVINIINAKVKDEVRKLDASKPDNSYSSASSASTISQERGPSGPPGGEYLASGLLINKKYSYDSNNNLNMSVTRVHGEGDTGKAYLEIKDNFSPSTYWYLYKDGTLRNRLDNSCLTSNGKSDLFMKECSGSSNQIWEWDNKTNRILLKDTKNNTASNQKCIKLTTPKIDENTLLAGCSNNSCGDKHKRFLKLDSCSPSVQTDEVWSFT